MNPTVIDEMGFRMGEVYGSVTDAILVNLAKHFPYIRDDRRAFSAWQYQVEKLAEIGQIRQETIQILQTMLGGADAGLQTALETAIMDALQDAEKPLQEAAKRGFLNPPDKSLPELAPNEMQAFRGYYRQSADKLNLVNTVMLESTEQAYTATVADIVNRMSTTQGILNEAAGGVIAGVTTLNQAMRDGVQKMISNGITGFIDHAGRRWSPEAYVTMDTRTTMARTARAAIWERQEQYGNDLYQVSYHDGARPLCYPWQGKVISRSDTPRDVTDDEGNVVHVYAQSETSHGEAAGLFGVNCKHYPIPFVPGFSRIRAPRQNEQENAKEYEQSQQQRALERNLRNEKRDLAVLKAQGATDDEIKAQRERVRAASAKLDDFCDKTGRARRRSREYTPTNPTFPDKDTYDPGTFRKTQRDKMREFFSNGGDEPPPRPTPIHIPPPPEPPVAQVPVRPANEQEILKQFNRYDPATKTEAQKLAQVNPNFSTEERKWRHNCQRTVVAEELVQRGYNVRAKAYNASDPIKDSGTKCWKFSDLWFKDPEVAFIEKRGNFQKTAQAAFQQWGDGARAIVRIKWSRGSGHFINAFYKDGKIVYVDPQDNTICDIDNIMKYCTKKRNAMWILRVDNRELTDLVTYAVENVEE